MNCILERERKMAKAEFLAAGGTKSQYKLIEDTAKAVLNECGFTSAEQVRHIANLCGRRY